MDFETRANAVAATIGSTINYVRVTGFATVGDGGAALYKRVGIEPAHAGKFQSADGAWWELVPPLNAAQFGVKADGTTDNKVALANAISTALALGVALELPSGGSNINVSALTSQIEIPAGKTLEIWSNGTARIALTAGTQCIWFIGTTVASGLTLTAPIAWGDTKISINNASSVQVGDMLLLSTATSVEASYGYKKGMLAVVGAIVGNDIRLEEACNFDFTVAETNVKVLRSGHLKLRNFDLQCASGTNIRFEYLRRPYFVDMSISGPGVRDATDCLLISACDGVLGERLRLRNGRYTINNSNYSRNGIFRDIDAEGTQHPIDSNTFAFNTLIQRINGRNNTAILECHPSFETKFEDVYEIIAPNLGANLVGLRCYGGSVKRAKSIDYSTTPVSGGGGVISLPAYAYLGQLYDRLYEDIIGLRGGLGAREVRRLVIRNSQVYSINCDSTDAVGSVEVDDRTTTVTIVDIKRLQQTMSPRATPPILIPTDEWAARGTIIDITNITQANPGVVTAVAHGRVNGDVVRINGVTGMTQINARTFTVANATANTFVLSGVDTSAYPAYTSGGKLTPGISMKATSVKQVPYLGWHPVLNYKSVLRSTAVAVGATSITIPFKLSHNYYIQEGGSRQLDLILRAFSRNRGQVAARYVVTIFQGSGSIATVSTAAALGNTGTLIAAIGNIAPHYYTQITSEGGNPANDWSEYYLTGDVTATLTSGTDP